MGEGESSLLKELPYLDMGSAFMIGLAVGYFLKKSFKLMLILLGMSVVVLFVMESQHLISINEDGLERTVSVGISYFKEFAFFLKERLSRLKTSGSVSAVAGFFVGLKMG